MSWAQCNAMERQLAAQQREVVAMKKSMMEVANGKEPPGKGKGKAKGKGKGKETWKKGKGRGKGQSWGAGGQGGMANGNDWDWPKLPTESAQEEPKEEWPCCLECCTKSVGKLNYGHKTACNWCGATKNKAMNPPAAERRGASPIEVLDDDMQVESAAPLGIGGAQAVMLKPDETEMLKAMGLTTIRARDTSKKIFLAPQALDLRKTADEEVAALCRNSDQLAATQASVTFYRESVKGAESALSQAISDVAKEGGQMTLDFFKQKLVEKEKACTELGKKNATGEAQLHDLTAKRSQAERKESERVQKAVTVTTAAQEKFQRLRAVLSGQVEMIQERIEALKGDFETASEAALERATDLAKRHVERMTAWETRITAAELASSGSPTEEAASAPAVPATLDGANGKVAKEAKETKGEAKEVKEEQTLAQAIKAAEDAKAQAEALNLKVQEMQQEKLKRGAQTRPPVAGVCTRRIRYSADELVPLKRSPTKPEQVAIANLAANVKMWLSYSLVPVTYLQLLHDDENVSFQGIQEMIGPILWKRFYGEGPVVAESYVPAQMASILNAVFIKMDKDTQTLFSEAVDGKQSYFEEIEEKDEEDRAGSTGAYMSCQY